MRCIQMMTCIKMETVSECWSPHNGCSYCLIPEDVTSSTRAPKRYTLATSHSDWTLAAGHGACSPRRGGEMWCI